MLLTIYHRVGSEWRNQLGNGICDRSLVDLDIQDLYPTYKLTKDPG